AARRKNYLSMLVVTVDQLDAYRQCYGMIDADNCLKKVASELKRFARRPGDIAARYGDDLFYVVLADTGIENATLVAQNMLDNIRSLKLPNDFSKIEPYVTVSIGVASLIPLPSMFPADLADKAKKANKVSEKQGHNQVVSFSSI
ncbi:MAG: GGDEF domain-containing protein, partial [Pseudomonadales bacterium]|nr:GGDEF domain-containing protein [Pseudomonadales bacterium]